jgi:hypothetical protein
MPGTTSAVLWSRGLAAGGLGLAMIALSGCGQPAAPANSSAAAPSNTAAAAPPAAAQPAPAPPGPVSTVHYVNSVSAMQNLQLAGNLAFFSFDYPSTWRVDPMSGNQAFIAVQRFNGPDAIESFMVLPLPATVTDQQTMYQALTEWETKLSSNPTYRRIDESQTTFSGAQALQLRFTLSSSTGRLRYSRIIIVPGMAGGSGMMVMMFADDGLSDVHSIDELGVKGQLPTILNSFKLGDRPT